MCTMTDKRPEVPSITFTVSWAFISPHWKTALNSPSWCTTRPSAARRSVVLSHKFATSMLSISKISNPHAVRSAPVSGTASTDLPLATSPPTVTRTLGVEIRYASYQAAHRRFLFFLLTNWRFGPVPYQAAPSALGFFRGTPVIGAMWFRTKPTVPRRTCHAGATFFRRGLLAPTDILLLLTIIGYSVDSVRWSSNLGAMTARRLLCPADIYRVTRP